MGCGLPPAIRAASALLSRKIRSNRDGSPYGLQVCVVDEQLCPAAQSALERHTTQVLVAVRQRGVIDEQSESRRHPMPHRP
jgi:hypothetical protein